MKNKYLPIVFFFAAYSSRAAQPVDYVSPLMGTLSKHSLSAGNTYPAVCRPWGMNFWTPQTGKMGDGWQYTYTADKIRGIKQTHQPSPWINDYGQFAIMPTAGKVVFGEEERASWFSHKAETAKPYYYKVYLADHDITAELTPTQRAAMMRITFPKTDSACIVVDAFDNGSEVEVVNKTTLRGFTTKNSGGVPDGFRNYFVVVFDKPFDEAILVADGRMQKNIASISAQHAGAIVRYSTAKGAVVRMRIASSFISYEQAMQNLRELGDGFAFDAIADAGREEWNRTLGVVDIKDDNVDNVRTFYSCLYRCVLFPRSFFEIDKEGNILHYSPYNGKVEKGYMFTDAGFWDIFRAQCPLLNLLYPTQSAKMQQGLANAYKESGFLPEWASPGHRDCMVGNNSASVVADAYLSGVGKFYDYDIQTLWKAVTSGANAVHPKIRSTGRLGWDYYNRLGYVPYDVKINESAARTLEYAFADWSIYQLGRALGKNAADIAPYAKRAFNYANLFDSTTNLMRGKLENGAFAANFNPLKWGDAFTEGNSWHYTWSVFHDPLGLIALMGGRERFTAMMDSVWNVPPLFDDSYYGGIIHEIREMQITNMGNYAHGNQPIQHFIYLYDYARQPWKTQWHARSVMAHLYSPTPDGYCGDEDNGQTSAWFVLSALGIYPLCPGAGEYAVGSPLFKQANIRLENGAAITISAPANSEKNVFIRAMKLNGSGYNRNYLLRAALLNGANIEYEMADEPNLERGTDADSEPYSFSKEYKK